MGLCMYCIHNYGSDRCTKNGKQAVVIRHLFKRDEIVWEYPQVTPDRNMPCYTKG